MIKRDLLQRQIEELGKTLSKVIADLYDLKTTGKFGAAVEAASQMLSGQLDVDIGKLLGLKPENFLNKLKSNKGFSHENLEKLGDILLFFAEEGSVYDKEKLYGKCLTIYEFLEQDEKIYSFERRAKIAGVKKRYDDFLKRKNL